MPIPHQHTGVRYTELLSTLCRRREARTYLEVGVFDGSNLSKIEVERAIGVDPAFHLSFDVTTNKKSVQLFRMTSDRFFAEHSETHSALGSVDFAFLDGMHLFEYLLRDFYNTERLCSRNAVIAMHDCLPLNGEMIERVSNPAGRTPGPLREAWTGDVWKIIPILRKYRPDLDVKLVNCEPTGLVLVTNLDPASQTLDRGYLDIVREFHAMPNTAPSIESLYSELEILDAATFMDPLDHTLYFKT